MAKEVNLSEMRKVIKKMVSEIVEIPEDELKDNASFAEELGVDSMMALEIVAGIEKKYRVTIPEEELPNIRTIQNVYEAVEKALK